MPNIGPALEGFDRKPVSSPPELNLEEYKDGIVTDPEDLDRLYRNLLEVSQRNPGFEYFDPPKINSLRRDGKYGEFLSNAAKSLGGAVESLRRKVKDKVRSGVKKVESFVGSMGLSSAEKNIGVRYHPYIKGYIKRFQAAVSASEGEKRGVHLRTKRQVNPDSLLVRFGQDSAGHLDIYSRRALEKDKGEVPKRIYEAVTVCDGVGSGPNSHEVSFRVLEKWHDFLRSKLPLYENLQGELPIREIYIEFLRKMRGDKEKGIKRDKEIDMIRNVGVENHEQKEQNNTTLHSVIVDTSNLIAYGISNGDGHMLVFGRHGDIKFRSFPDYAHDSRGRLTSSVFSGAPKIYAAQKLAPGDVVIVCTDAIDKGGLDEAIKQISLIIKENGYSPEKLAEFFHQYKIFDDVSFASTQV